jgi:beta-phosphoglucomutase-like phosphatase (HAD superfamily)
MKTRAFIFDMDGTMIDSMPFHAKSWSEFMERHAITLPVEEVLRRTTGRTGVECMRELFGAGLPDDRAAALVDEKETIYRDLFAPAFAEVRGFRRFAQLATQGGLKLAVGTAGDQQNIDFALKRLELDPPPDAVVGGDQGLAGKPDPAIFLEAARRLAVPAAQCIVFEDAPLGIEAARRAGMRAVAICSSHTGTELSGAHVLAQVRDYEELMTTKFLESLDA